MVYSLGPAVSDLDPVEVPRGWPLSSELVQSRVARAFKLSPLFAQVERSTWDALMSAASLEIIAAGRAIFEQGAPAEALVLLHRGRARTERVMASGGAFPLGYRGPGDVLGEACLGGLGTRTERVVAMEEAEVVLVPLGLVHAECASDAALRGAVLSLLLARQRESEDRIESMLFRNVEGRLAEFLLKAAERWGVPSPRGVLISAQLTHAEIAQVIGSTRETVTLTLGALRKAGVLDVAGRRLIVRDREGLARKK
jgi:CRP/FNR family transcriptional regulator, cyclic AMP receptor protein